MLDLDYPDEADVLDSVDYAGELTGSYALLAGVYDASLNYYAYGIYDGSTYAADGILDGSQTLSSWGILDASGNSISEDHGVLSGNGNTMQATGTVDSGGNVNDWGIIDNVGNGESEGVLYSDGDYCNLNDWSTDPQVANVRLGTPYRQANTALEGTLGLPDSSDVRNGVKYGILRYPMVVLTLPGTTEIRAVTLVGRR